MVRTGDVVRPTAGRDTGKLMFVFRVDGEYAVLVNGRSRPLNRPKRKKLKHLSLEYRGDCMTAAKLRAGTHPTDKEIRSALAVYMGVSRQSHSGNRLDVAQAHDPVFRNTACRGVEYRPDSDARKVEEGR